MPILQVRDKDGNFVSIPAIQGDKGEKGEQGKSAYEQAKEGGYTGTEEEFIVLLNGLESAASVEYVDEQTKSVTAYVDEQIDDIHENMATNEYVDEQIANVCSYYALYKQADGTELDYELTLTNAYKNYKRLLFVGATSNTNPVFQSTDVPVTCLYYSSTSKRTFRVAGDSSQSFDIDMYHDTKSIYVTRSSSSGYLYSIYGIK